MIAVHEVHALKCGEGGLHQVRSARLRVETARRSDQEFRSELYDERARFRHGIPAWWVQPPHRSAKADRVDPAIADWNEMHFVGRQPATGRLIVEIVLARAAGGAYTVGGTVHHRYRGLGFGREALTVVCLLAHRHFGITELTAGCEHNNTASRRWLQSCGFEPSDGPVSLVLPNGRAIESRWWRHFDESAERRCRTMPAT